MSHPLGDGGGGKVWGKEKSRGTGGKGGAVWEESGCPSCPSGPHH